jgi:acyl-CoA reductase-like NAD-dependent aldehyde dehydrogenase
MVVEDAIASKYRNAGQICVCANRLYQAACRDRRCDEGGRRVRAGRHDRAADRLKAVEKVEAHIADAVRKISKNQDCCSTNLT